MTRETAKQLWPIIKAWAEGETIQKDFSGTGHWLNLDDQDAVAFSSPASCYRIKPKPREFWVNIYPPKRQPVMGAIYASKEEAQKNAMADSLECIRVVEAEK